MCLYPVGSVVVYWSSSQLFLLQAVNKAPRYLSKVCDVYQGTKPLVLSVCPSLFSLPPNLFITFPNTCNGFLYNM